LFVGAVRPGLDHDKNHYDGSDAYSIFGANGSLNGNGKIDADPQGELVTGDHIGVLLDLDAGWMRFYRNGKRWGPGYTEGVTGPLVRAAMQPRAHVQQSGETWRGMEETVTVLPGAVAPEGAGDEGELAEHSI
jgi:hypothetical protein